MVKYKLTKTAYDLKTGERIQPARPEEHKGLTIHQVAERVEQDPDDILWAIEEYGHFDIMVGDNPDLDWHVEEEE